MKNQVKDSRIRRCAIAAALVALSFAAVTATAETIASVGSQTIAISPGNPTRIVQYAANMQPVPMPDLPNGEVPSQVAIANGVWVLAASGNLFFLSAQGPHMTWVQQAGSANSILGAPDGTLWAIGKGSAADNPIYKWTGSAWATLFGAAAASVAVNTLGEPELVNSSNTLLTLNLFGPSIWQPAGAPPMRSIYIGSKGTTFALDPAPMATSPTTYKLLYYAPRVSQSYPTAGWNLAFASVYGRLQAAAVAINETTGMLWCICSVAGRTIAGIQSIPLTNFQ